MWFAVLGISLYVLLKAADFFVDTAELFGAKMKIPSFIVGATVVAFGTSLPELAVALASIFKGEPNIIAGTVIGSNISNIFLIGGIAILMSSAFLVSFKKHIVEFSVLIGTTILLAYFLWDFHVGLVEGIISVAVLFAYVAYLVIAGNEEEDEDEEEENEANEKIGAKTIGLFILSGIGIWAGAQFTTLSITKISMAIGLGSDIISQTIVALGTSLPELAVTLAAVRKLKFNLVLGNIVGSNIFNSLCVIGIPAVVGYFTIGPDAFKLADPAFHTFSIPVMLLATALIFTLSLMKKTPKAFGFLFVCLYAIYIIGSFLMLNLQELI